MPHSRCLVLLALLAASFLRGSIVFAEGEEAKPSSLSSESTTEGPPETVVTTTEDVQPLDHWVESGAEESSPEAETPTNSPLAVTGEIPEDLTPIPTPKYHFPLIGAERINLKKAQKTRLDKVDKKLRTIVYKEHQERLKDLKKNPRGENEIRICSVNFNGYGTKEENERLLKKIPKPRIAKAERTILKAIVSSNCDVVAVQGIIGRSPPFATDALSAFATKLSKKTNKIPWKVEIAHSKEQNGYQGFLIKSAEDSSIEGFQVETFPNTILKVPGKPLRTSVLSKNDMVPRDFLKITLDVKSKDTIPPDAFALDTKSSFKPLRQVVIINGILAKGVAPFQADESLLKLQIADVAVRLFDVEQSRVTPNEQPIVIAAVERVEGVLGAAEHILTGRLNLDDFEAEGICKILDGKVSPHKEEGAGEEEATGDEEVKKEEKPKPSKVIDFTVDTAIECKNPIERPKLRFDLLAEVPFSPKPKPEGDAPKKAPKIPLRDLELQTEGLFVVTADLKYTAKKGTNLLDSAAGRVEIANGLPGAYLVWVDLNW